MKLLATSLAAVIGLLVPSSSHVDPGIARIRLTGTVVSQSGNTKVYALYNQPTYRLRIGTGFVTCEPISARFENCEATFRLSRGQVVSRGVVASSATYRLLAVTGGTDFYSNVGGQLSVLNVGNGLILLIADLEAF